MFRYAPMTLIILTSLGAFASNAASLSIEEIGEPSHFDTAEGHFDEFSISVELDLDGASTGQFWLKVFGTEIEAFEVQPSDRYFELTLRTGDLIPHFTSTYEVEVAILASTGNEVVELDIDIHEVPEPEFWGPNLFMDTSFWPSTTASN